MGALLHIGTGDEAVVERLRTIGVDILASSDDPNAHQVFDVAMIAPAVEAPLQVARRIRAGAPDAHIVFLTTPATEASLRRELMVGRIGTQWTIASAEKPETVADVVREAFAGTERRRKLRTTLGRANQQLAEQPLSTARRTTISDHFLAVVLDQLSDAVVVLDPEGLVLAWNGAAARAFGEIRRGVFFGHTLPSAAHEAIEAARNSRGGTAESVLALPTTRTEYSIRATALRGNSGEVIGVAVVARDVTAARNQERQRQFVADSVRVLASTLDARNALQHLAELLVVDFADVAAADVVDGDDVNRYAAAARTTREVELMQRLLGDTISRNRSHPSLDAIFRGETVVRNDVDEAVLAAAASSDEHLAVLRELRPHAYLTVPLRGGDQTIGALLVARTTGEPFSQTDVHTLQEIAREASTTLHNIWSYHAAFEAARLKDEFLATLSHELRTPMTSILGWSQILRLEDTPADLIGDGLESIERSARAQAQLIDDLLDLSRMQMGKVQFHPRMFSLSTVVRSAVDTVRPAAQARGVELIVEADPELSVSGDPDRMQQVLWNLVSNAVKFSDSGSEVRIRVTAVDGSARVTVADRGRGIAPEFLPHVFDRFRQADAATTRRYGGLGLGLAIVKQLVEMHGGTVRASSAGVGRGATFTITLPLPHASARKAFDASAESEAPARLPDLSNVYVQLVDDDQSSAETIRMILERAGANVRVAHSVAAALQALRERLPDILISDVAMPDEDGLALIRAVRGRLRISAERMPAIALTAFSDVGLRVELLGAGFQRFMLKPFDAQALARLVATLTKRGD
jgi:signal transduction histidine kinase/CheY-like chemotaxis protein